MGGARVSYGLTALGVLVVSGARGLLVNGQFEARGQRIDVDTGCLNSEPDFVLDNVYN